MYKMDQQDSLGSQNIGLGLHVCRDILKMYNGEINFESSVDSGSTFYFNIELEHQEKEEL